VRKAAPGWGATDVPASWADREAEAQWGGERLVGKERRSGPWLGRNRSWADFSNKTLSNFYLEFQFFGNFGNLYQEI
jgi:hypothetical protein